MKLYKFLVECVTKDDKVRTRVLSAYSKSMNGAVRKIFQENNYAEMTVKAILEG